MASTKHHLPGLTAVHRHENNQRVSHHFSQGLVSADLLLMRQEYRDAVLREVRAAERKKRGRAGNTFSALFRDAVSPSRLEVVYAIIGKWSTKGLKAQRRIEDALPFFSKVNLRRCATDLRRMGYRIPYNPPCQHP